MLDICKDQVPWAGGPTRVNIEKPEDVNEGNDVEKPKREPAPVQRLMRPGAIWQTPPPSPFSVESDPIRPL